MSSSVSRRRFLRTSLYAAGAAGVGLQANVPQLLAQTAPAGAAPSAETPATINLGSNTLSIGPSRPSLEAITRIAPESGNYGGAVSREMLDVLSEHLGVPPDRISVYPGSGTPLGLAVMMFTSAQGSLVTADPSYEQPWRNAAKVDAKVIKVPQRADFSHDVQAMCAADASAGMIYICNPNNPTGAVTTRADIEYALHNKPAGSILLVDEAYIEFSDTAVSAVDLAASRDDVIVLRTFSKLYGMAGLRLGYAVASPANLDRMNFYGRGSVAMTTLAAGIASLSDPGLIPERRGVTRRLREETVAWLEGQGYPCSISECNCFVVEIGRSAREFQEAMATHGVMIGRSWPGFETQPRISVGTEAEMARFREAFTAVLAGRLGPLPVQSRQRVALQEESLDPEQGQFIC